MRFTKIHLENWRNFTYVDVVLQRELEILQRVASGERNKEIAARLRISEPTVKSRVS